MEIIQEREDGQANQTTTNMKLSSFTALTLGDHF